MQLDRLLLQAATITWRRRSLWILGLLATAGGLILSLFFRIAFLRPAAEFEPDALVLTESLLNTVSPRQLVGGVLGMFLLVLLLWLLSAIAEGSLIVAVRSIEEGQAPRLIDSLRAGLGLLGRFIGIDTLLFLPLFILALALMGVGTGGLAGLVYAATRPAAQIGDMLLVVGISSLVSLPILLLMILTAVVLFVLRALAFRAAALEGLSASQSIRRGWGILRHQALSVSLLALVLWAIRSVAGTPLRLIGYALVGAGLAQYLLAASNPAAGSDWISLFLAFAGLIVAVLSWLVAGVLNAYGSTSWTLAYGRWVDERA